MKNSVTYISSIQMLIMLFESLNATTCNSELCGKCSELLDNISC